jgi:opacity protein-like surface antigen
MKSLLVSKKLLLTLAMFVAVATTATNALAQVEQPSQINFQGTGLFTSGLKDQSPSYDADKSAGFLTGYSYQFSKVFGAEGNYGYSRNTHNFAAPGSTSSVQTDFHQMTAALVAHIPGSKGIRPYVLGGGGAVVFDPTDKFVVTGAERQTRGAFVYGGGANFDITSKFGIRAEYRGLAYKAPDFEVSDLKIDRFTHLAQPSAGFFFRF